ncbi:hypothetical protein [Enterobacter bugandensis]|uniref:hypothetical protein n=1 Tax=Enterobacter bugandensis TaxID=881260 RepID=UPI0013F4DC8E|nr:hypothetical protein [Enterobacter bugandensis]
MGYKAGLSVSFNFFQNPASAGFLLLGFRSPGMRIATRQLAQTTSILIFATLSTFHCMTLSGIAMPTANDRYHKISP